MKQKIKTYEYYLKLFKEKHGDKYDYSLVNYVKSKQKIDVICKKHGVFQIEPLYHANRGTGCPKCAREYSYNIIKNNKDRFVNKANKIHNNKYDYSLVNYKGFYEKIKIICPEHGLFEQTPESHYKHKCPKCAIIESGIKSRLTKEQFIQKANYIHNNKYDYSKTIYEINNKKIIITCPEHGDFLQKPNDHLSKRGCPKCGNKTIREDKIYSFLYNYNQNIINNKRILDGKELDIFIPEKNIGIEFDGLYWHSNKFKDKKYHLLKTEQAEKQGIQLIHIFEDEWVNKQEIVKSRLLNIIGKTPHKIYARKCEIKIVDKKEERDFLNENHIQGYSPSKICLGLYYENELVSLMNFSNLRKNLGQQSKEGYYELLRFCNKLYTNVIGGASKLFKYFIRNIKFISIISYADRRWSIGNLYKQLGFKFISYSQPNYFYIKGLKRFNRFNFRKDILVKQGYDKNKTEFEIMDERKIYRIYDCGTLKFEYYE